MWFCRLCLFLLYVLWSSLAWQRFGGLRAVRSWLFLWLALLSPRRRRLGRRQGLGRLDIRCCRFCRYQPRFNKSWYA